MDAREKKLAHKVVSGRNDLTLKYLNQVQKCIEHLDRIGLHVINVEFCKIKPTVRVQAPYLDQEQRLVNDYRAIRFMNGNDSGRFQEYQMMVEGIRVVWRAYLH
ncbi:hypothetical protein [Lonepinella koalarum]|uniref:hypothetical protein n=1 Tax=Lonepinella koalarum TaxID=53417 RepID=UPI003F6DD960